MPKHQARKKKTSSGAAVKQRAKPGNKNLPVILLLAGLTLFLAVEVNNTVQRKILQDKRPDFVASLPKTYSGLTSMGLYGNFLYGVDNTAGTVYKINKQDGKLVKLFHIPEGIFAAVEDSKGDAYFLDRQNTVQVYGPDDRLKRKIKLDGRTFTWLEVDAKDNFYAVDGESCSVTKYDPQFKKLLSFGSKGPGGRDNFVSIGKIYAGVDGLLYCLDFIEASYAHVKVMDMNGKFIREWAIRNMKKFTLLENLVITEDGHIYINSFEGSSVFVFDRNGRFLNNFDTDSKKKFAITYPASLAGGKDGLLYVVTHEIGIFRPIKY